MNLIEHFVNGKIIPGSSDRKGKVFNPATGEQESEVRLASKSDLDQAVEAAKKAFETWSAKPPLQRARIIFKFKELIEKNSDELTKLIVSEHGKVFASSPTARTDFLPASSITATTDGSFKTTPWPFTTTNVFAVPRSIAIS